MALESFATVASATQSAVIQPFGVQEAVTRGIANAIPYQITIGTTATAQIEGRMSADHAWFIIGASTTSTEAGVLTVVMPEMRVNVTAHTSGDVDAAILLP
jgi:hypothetical protein